MKLFTINSMHHEGFSMFYPTCEEAAGMMVNHRQKMNRLSIRFTVPGQANSSH